MEYEGEAPRHASSGADHELVYNLFRRKEEAELHCAVPEDRVVPSFIDDEGWAFCGTLSTDTAAVPGFDDAAARAGVRFNGFYLFQSY